MYKRRRQPRQRSICQPYDFHSTISHNYDRIRLYWEIEHKSECTSSLTTDLQSPLYFTDNANCGYLFHSFCAQYISVLSHVYAKPSTLAFFNDWLLYSDTGLTSSSLRNEENICDRTAAETLAMWTKGPYKTIARVIIVLVTVRSSSQSSSFHRFIWPSP